MEINQAPLTAAATARPIRVAYLLSLADCPDALLNAIFAEAYSRWGGRHTLIVPASADGIDASYSEWLLYFDPDIIYSFVSLTDVAVADLHERFAPAYLIRHREWPPHHPSKPTFRIDLPIKGLSSLSVLPALVSRYRPLDLSRRSPKLFTSFWDRSTSPFLQENFGLLSKSFTNTAIASDYPNLFSTLTLITEESLADRYVRKDERATYVTHEERILEALGTSGGDLLTLAQLSDCFSPILGSYGNADPDGAFVVIGDTPSDRILFWNIHHRFELRPVFPEIASLRIPFEKATDDAFLEHIRKILLSRGVRANNGRNDHIYVISCSLDRPVLEEIASRLRRGKMSLHTSVRHVDHTAAVPNFRNREFIKYHFGSLFWGQPARTSTEFFGNRVPVPLVLPWHLKEALPPPALRNGDWMLDLEIDRAAAPYRSSYRQTWRLPRRLRLDPAFEYEFESTGPRDSVRRHSRVVRTGLIGIPVNFHVTRASVTTPDDDASALRVGLCNGFEWIPFDSDRSDSPCGRQRFAFTEYSNEGRYLIGVLQLFESVPAAFNVLMHGYWRDVLYEFCGVKPHIQEERQNEFLTKLRRRLGQSDGPLQFTDDAQLSLLANVALKEARAISGKDRVIRFEALQEKWSMLIEEYMKLHPSTGQQDPDDRIEYQKNLTRSVQYLCQRKVLFQGHQWTCDYCKNINWVSIDDLRSTMPCSVCGRVEPAFVSGEWEFRVNPFVVQAYRDDGVEPVIWALWHLSDRSRTCFYFTPSLELSKSYPGKKGGDAEVDAVAVVDGAVYVVEAKRSARITDHQIDRLLCAVEHIRPDVLLFACMEATDSRLGSITKRIRAGLPTGVELEILSFDPTRLDWTPFLPA